MNRRGARTRRSSTSRRTPQNDDKQKQNDDKQKKNDEQYVVKENDEQNKFDEQQKEQEEKLNESTPDDEERREAEDERRRAGGGRRGGQEARGSNEDEGLRRRTEAFPQHLLERETTATRNRQQTLEELQELAHTRFGGGSHIRGCTQGPPGGGAKCPSTSRVHQERRLRGCYSLVRELWG